MPDVGGLELLATVRRRWPNIIRILLTGATDIMLGLEAINAGEVFQVLH